MSKSIVFCVLLAASLWQVACACSCRSDVTLEQKYQQADHILVAKISGCAPGKSSEDGLHCGRHGWTFETVENLKGSDAVVRTEPSDDGASISTCDISLTVGDTYLLFLRDGRSYQCSGTGSLSGAGGARMQSEVEILRAYRDGAMTRIIDPWHFSDGGGRCGIAHMLDGGVQARFAYAYARPPESVQQQTATFPKPTPTLTLQLLGPFKWAGPTRIEVNGESVSLTQRTFPLPGGRTYSVEVVQGDAVLALLDRMVKPADLIVSGSRSHSYDNAAASFLATTNTARAAEAVAKFKACVAAHPAQ